MISYIFYRLFGWLTPRIPPRLGYWLFARIGDLFYWLDTNGRRAVEDNLRHVMGPNVPSTVFADKVRETFQMQAYNYFDMFRIPATSDEEIQARVTVEGWEHMEEALSQGNGVIAVSAHFGNVDILLQMIGLLDLKATLVTEHLKPERLFQYVADIRSRHGIEIVPVDASLKPIFRALRAGELVVLALDRDVTGNSVNIEFFGEQARLPDGYARLSRRTGAPIVLAFGVRLPDHHIRVRVEPALEVPQTEDRTRDTRTIMRWALDIAEGYIAEHPEQWVMFRPVWQ